MDVHSIYAGRFRWIGALLLSCLVAAIFLQGCGTTNVLKNVKIQEVKPPEALLTCEGKPATPSIDQLSGPDGDNVLAAYLARQEYARKDCWCSVEELRAFVNKTPAPAECKKPQTDPESVLPD